MPPRDFESLRTPVDAPAPSPFEAGARALIVDGMMAQAMASVVGGAFLAAFALALGASRFQIGLLAALPPAGQMFQLVGVAILRRAGGRKRVAVAAAALSRVMWLLVAAVPLAFSGPAAFSAVALLVLAASACGAVGGLAWTSWMRDLVPEPVMGRFFSKRMMFATLAAIGVSLAAGAFVDAWAVGGGQPVRGYSLVFAAGVLLGSLGLPFLLRVQEAPPAQGEGAGEPLLATLRRPFRDANFLHLLKFSAAWTFAITFAAPFYVVYLLERIGLPMSRVVLLTVVSQVFTLLSLRFWGRIADKFSNRSGLGAAGGILLLAIAGWTFTTLPEPHRYTMPLLFAIHAAMGLAMGGITLSTGNIGLKLSPAGQAEAYLTSLGLVNAVVAFASPLLAGVLADWLAPKGLTLTLTFLDGARAADFTTISLRGLDFLFLITVLLGLYAMHRLAFVQEEGSVSERAVFEELREQIFEDVRAIASFAALRQVVSFTAGMLPRAVRLRFGSRRDGA